MASEGAINVRDAASNSCLSLRAPEARGNLVTMAYPYQIATGATRPRNDSIFWAQAQKSPAICRAFSSSDRA